MDALEKEFMQATLIYNPNAGINVQLSPDKLLDALKQAGYDPIYIPTLQENDLDEALSIAERIPMAKQGTVEVRPVVELDGLPN